MLAHTERTAQETILFVKSLRKFGGIYQNSDVLVMVPSQLPLSESNQITLGKLDARIETLSMDDALLKFPFAAKSVIAGMAEELVEDSTEQLIWMDRDGLIIQEPSELILPAGKMLAYRPVDHQNIGSAIDKPLNPFWQTVYSKTGVSEEMVFPIQTSVEGLALRPYINAGMLVVRPKAGLLRRWGESFQAHYQTDELKPFYEEHIRYKIFVHQAILSAVLTKELPREAWYELPYRVNYPLHMHKDYPTDRKVKDINELITCRYDMFFESEEWTKLIGLGEPFGSWLLEESKPVLKVIGG